MGSYSGWWFQPTLKLKNISQIENLPQILVKLDHFPR